MAIKGKVTKAQQRILDKYADITDILDFKQEIRDKVGVRSARRLESTKAKYAKQIRQTSAEINVVRSKIKSYQKQGRSARDLILQELKLEERLRQDKRAKFDADLDFRAAKGHITVDGVEIEIGDYDLSEFTEEELAKIEDLRDSLEYYRFSGDRTRDRFYHIYGFDSVSDRSLILFAKGEGII